MKKKLFYSSMKKVTYPELHRITNSLHMAIGMLSEAVDKAGLTKSGKDTITQICKTYIYWNEVIEKDFPNMFYTSEEVAKAILEYTGEKVKTHKVL